MLRKFFENHVKVNYTEWIERPLDERLAKNAVQEANNMAERVFHYWEELDTTQIDGAVNAGCYRSKLAHRECSDFALVRDIADAHKHVCLGRASRRVTRFDQTTAGATGWGEGGYGEGVYGGGPQLVVTLDDGTKRPLTAIMGNVMQMWDRLLSGWNL